MSPTITKKYEEGESTGFNPKLHFTLTDIDTSVANAIRRTVLSDIPVVCIRTDIKEEDPEKKCKIEANTTRFHNELIKQRLSCIDLDFNLFVYYFMLPNLLNNGHDIKLKCVIAAMGGGGGGNTN